jgi:hypothetical protein
LDTGNAALHLALFYLQKSAMAKKKERVELDCGNA